MDAASKARKSPAGRAAGSSEEQRKFRPAALRLVGGGLLLVLLVCAVYAPVYDAGYIWDDDDYVTENPNLRTGEGLERIWLQPSSLPQYYPLVHTSFWLEYRLWKLEPFGYHLVNVLLHGLNALLLWIVLLRLRVPGAFWAALLFALHPVQVESVAWITERKNVLSGAFFLLALLAYLRFALPERGSPTGERPGRPGRYWLLAFVLFVAALLSKSVTVSLPAVLLLILWWKQGRLGLRDLVPLLPLFAVGLGMASVTVWLERHHVGAMGVEWSFSLLERCLIAGRALWFYALKLFWPAPLIFNYPRWEIDAAQPLAYLYPAGVLVVLAALWGARQRLGRGPLVAVCLFAGMLLPALGFFDIYPMRYSFVADHFQYLASIGLIVLLVGALFSTPALQRGPEGGASSIVLAALCCGAALLSFQQSRIYADAETLWLDTVQKNPQSWMAYYHLGWLNNRAGNWSAAEDFYRKAIDHSRPPNRHHAMAMNNLAMVLARKGDPDQAEAFYRRALAVAPDFATALNNLGSLLRDRQRCDEALAQLDRAVQIDGTQADYHNNRGSSLACLGRLDAAEQAFLLALSLDPDNPAAHYNLANVYGRAGRYPEAERHLDEVVRIGIADPSRLRSVAAAYRRLQRPEKAAALLQRLQQ